MQFDLLMLGDLVADLILPIEQLPLRPEAHQWAEGLYVELGGGCNSIVAARRLDLATAALGAVGTDSYGERIKQMLAAEQVDVRHVLALEGRQTVLCVVVTDREGQHVFLGIKDEKPPIPLPPDWLPVITQSRTLLTNGYTLRELLEPEAVVTALKAAREAGVVTFFDPGPSVYHLERPLLEQVLAESDVLLLTVEEAGYLEPDRPPFELAATLRRYGPAAVVLKEGAAGCYIVDDREQIHQPAFEVPVVDTVGAGDAFAAALIAGYLRGGNWRDCAVLANAMGAAASAVQGAGRRLPPAERLLELLAGDPAAHLMEPDAYHR